MANKAVIEVIHTQKNIPPPYSFLECKRQLMSDFRTIYANDIHKVLKFHKGHYAESHKCLRLVMENLDIQLQNGGNKQAAHSDGVSLILKRDSEELKQEVTKVKEQTRILDERANRQFALSLLEEDYSKMGQLIECACCFGQCVFDNMAQCSEGHLVCVECLHSYINELIFGSGKVSVTCMTSECTGEYPRCELARCLDSKVLSKLEERTMLENLNTAKLEDLVRCPYCDYAAILPSEETTFTCQRDTCGKVTCRKCSNDWDDHVGLSCSMVETRDETTLRKSYEEKMTSAKVRRCSNCSTEFTKWGGCNLMTCRCGTTMCYICRKPGITHAHFFQFEKTRKVCPFTTNTKNDDERAIQEIKQEAERKRKALGYAAGRDIGAPAAKKTRFNVL